MADHGNFRPDQRYHPPGAALALAERINLDPELLGGTLAILESFFRDMVVFKYNTKKIINSDFQALLSHMDPEISTQRVLFMDH